MATTARTTKGMRRMSKTSRLEQLAEAAFVAEERVRLLEMLNTPTDYDERKKAFVALRMARAEANSAVALLDVEILK
jgi:hypothetical protein